MPAPENLESLLALVRESRLVEEEALAALVSKPDFPKRPEDALEEMVKAGLVTRFHAGYFAEGKSKGFLVGPYKVLRPLAKGGMGIVYLAEHGELKRRVALKVLLTDLSENAGAEERFRREGRAIAALDHPNIVRIHDFGQARDLKYLVMEYVEGKSMEQVLREKGGLPPGQVARYALQVADALRHAHERGVIHRDVKPANLLVARDDTVKVLDMGLARFYDDTADNLTDRVGRGSVLGTPDYIAPEQALHKADRQSDVYSLGATIYTMLLGEPPFPAPTASQKLMAHQLRAVTPPHLKDRRVPVELSLLVVRMMAKSPADRPQGLVEVVEALRPLAARADEPAEGREGAAPAGAPAAHRLWLWVGLGVAALLAVILGAWAALRG